MPGKLFWKRGEKRKVMGDLTRYLQEKRLQDCEEWMEDLQKTLACPEDLKYYVESSGSSLLIHFDKVIRKDRVETYSSFFEPRFKELGWDVRVETKEIDSATSTTNGQMVTFHLYLS